LIPLLFAVEVWSCGVGMFIDCWKFMERVRGMYQISVDFFAVFV